jgi:hypothetical protein
MTYSEGKELTRKRCRKIGFLFIVPESVLIVLFYCIITFFV